MWGFFLVFFYIFKFSFLTTFIFLYQIYVGIGISSGYSFVLSEHMDESLGRKVYITLPYWCICVWVRVGLGDGGCHHWGMRGIYVAILAAHSSSSWMPLCKSSKHFTDLTLNMIGPMETNDFRNDIFLETALLPRIASMARTAWCWRIPRENLCMIGLKMLQRKVSGTWAL